MSLPGFLFRKSEVDKVVVYAVGWTICDSSAVWVVEARLALRQTHQLGDSC